VKQVTAEAPPKGLVAADRASAVVFYDDFVIVQSAIGKEGTSGWTLGQDEVLSAPSDEELGGAILRSLEASYKQKKDAPLGQSEDRDSDLWRTVGARSGAAFVNSSRVVLVHQLDRRLLRPARVFFYPSRTLRNEGHSVLEGRELVSVDQSPIAIARRVREALDLCLGAG
jgi:hypothetical protein